MKIRDRCIHGLTLIGDELHRASDRTRVGLVAWGQFLDYDHSTEQTGTYGTAAAVKTLAITGEQDDSEYLKGGLNWLRQSYDDPQSKASKNDDWAIIYKICYFLDAMEPNSQEINVESVSFQYFQALLRRQLPNAGWGDYYFSDENKDPNGTIMATAFALYALRRYVPFANSSLGKEAASQFFQRLGNTQEMNSITIGLTILALNPYAEKHRELSSCLTALIKSLEEKAGRLPDSGMPEYAYHFTVIDRTTQRSRNRYIFLPVDAIVAYALIVSHRYKQNTSYINRVVSNYEQSVSINNAYSNPELAPRKSTVNQYWIALLMKAFIDLQPLGLWESIRFRLKRHPRLWKLILVLITLSVWAGVFFLILSLNSNPDPKYKGYSAAGSTAASLVVGFFVNRLWQRAPKEV